MLFLPFVAYCGFPSCPLCLLPPLSLPIATSLFEEEEGGRRSKTRIAMLGADLDEDEELFVPREARLEAGPESGGLFETEDNSELLT